MCLSYFSIYEKRNTPILLEVLYYHLIESFVLALSVISIIINYMILPLQPYLHEPPPFSVFLDDLFDLKEKDSSFI